MAKAFYNIEEAKEKLGVSDEELKALVRDGRLREFRDGGEIKYKGAEIDDLSSSLSGLGDSLGGSGMELGGSTLGGSGLELSDLGDTGIELGGSSTEEPALSDSGLLSAMNDDSSIELTGSTLGGSTGELILEPSDESSAGLTGSDMLTLDEADRDDVVEDADVVVDKGDDTVITSAGISVFDDEDAPHADPAAKTVLSEGQQSGIDLSLSSTGTGLGLSSTGTGSGLLDLTREADDTSLGGDFLDEIYNEDADQADATDDAEGSALAAASAAAAATGDRDAFEDEAAAAPVAAIAGTAVAVGGAFESGLTGAMFGALLTLCVAGITMAATLQGVVPKLLQQAYDHLPYVGGGFAALTLILFFVFFMVGRRS